MRQFLNWILPFLLLVIALTGKLATEKKLSAASLNVRSTPIQIALFQSRSLKKFSLGFSNVLAGAMWIRLVQKADTQPIRKGEVSWEYSQLDAITALDPNFEEAYSFGGIALSVFRQDKTGARMLLEKWVRHRPNYWRAHYMLGYHLYYELGNFSRGSKELLMAAGMAHAPSYLNALGIRLLSETGALAQALKMSIELFPLVKDREGQNRLVRRIRSLNYALQKAAWTNALSVYQKRYEKAPQQMRDIAPFASSELRTVASVVDDIPVELHPVLKEIFEFRYNPNHHDIESAQSLKSMDLEGTGIFIHGRGKNSDDDEEDAKSKGSS